MGASASLQSSTLAVTPGSSASVEVRVRNTGTVVDQFSVSVVGDAAGWSTVTPASVSLFPGADATVTVTFTPLAVAGGPSGPVPFGVRVASQEDPAGSVVEEGTLDVAPFLAVTVEVTPRTSRGRRSAMHEVAIDNQGTKPISATVTAVDPDGLLAFAVEPPTIAVAPNSASFVKVKIRPTKTFRKGPPLTRMFSVVVDEEGAPLGTAQGMMVQEATSPPWLRRAVLFSLLGLLLLTGLWFALLKPAVRSAAKEAAVEAVAPPTIGGGSGSGSGGGGAGSASGASSTGTASGVVAAGANTVGGRLFLTDKGTESYEVPAGSTLQLTDIVLQNPAGESGPLQIRRNGTALLVVDLSNFRDLDYHFVAPIVFTAGQKLELHAECTSPTCTPGAYFAGYLVGG
ncbi:MAG: hypothetical protein QOF60_787 [Actinomycetota bacterium]|nr:hypothetical protein [Actinomycetota bacterium]